MKEAAHRREAVLAPVNPDWLRRDWCRAAGPFPEATSPPTLVIRFDFFNGTHTKADMTITIS